MRLLLAFCVLWFAQDQTDPVALTNRALEKLVAAKDNAETLRADVEPLAEKALALRERDPDTPKADLAFALELEAHVLNREGRGRETSPLATRAALIREELVRGLAPRAPDGPVYETAPNNGVTPPRVLTKIDPAYPESARPGKFSGSILLSAVVGTDGVPTGIELLQGSGFGLDEQAARALAQWRFNPGTMNGQPVPVRVKVEINFRLL
jgi:TonB family protein